MKCLRKLQKCKHKTKTFLDFWIQTDNYTQQDFRVIKIRKSGSNYNASPLKCLRADDKKLSRTSYSQSWNQSMAIKNQISQVSSFLKHLQRLQWMNVENCRTQRINSAAGWRMHRKKNIFYNNFWNLKNKKF